MKLDINRSIMEINDSYAAQNRALFKEKKVFVINILGSPGAGKTSLLEALLGDLNIKAAVIEGDLSMALDAERIRACNIPVLQINTHGGCHLDAKMIGKVLSLFNLEEVEILIIENVGNLVCPADFDLGEDLRIVVLSIAEGMDKPMKYQNIFFKASVVVINKIDLLPFTDVSIEKLRKELLLINPKLHIFEVCSRPRYLSGINKLIDYLKSVVSNTTVS